MAGIWMVAELADANNPGALLAAIVADPDLGSRALSHPATLFRLLCDYLPDSPDAGLLLAACQVDVPRALRGYLARGLMPSKAIQLAATRVAARTDFTDEACLWAACEFALALGLVTADELPDAPAPAALATAIPVEPALAPGAGPLRILPAGGPRRPQGYRRGPSRRRRIGLAAMIAVIAAALAAAIGTAALALTQHHVASRSPAPPTAHARTIGSSPARPSQASARPTPSTARPSPTPSSVSPSTVSPPPPPPDPAQVATEYVADVNSRNWPALWQLGGGSVVLTYATDPGPLTYSEMVATFAETVSVTITSLTSAGDTVSIRSSALDTAGVTQYYEIKLVVRDGRIIAGSQYLL
jgi:hypothetical protein